MNETIIAAKIVLANTYVLYFKAHSFHWNVEGESFPQYHDFFGDFYQEVYGAVDKLAEEIRALGDFAPRSIDEMYKFKTISDQNQAIGSREMFMDLQTANSATLDSLNKLFSMLTAANEHGFANFIADRMDAHKKHAWMLTSILKPGN